MSVGLGGNQKILARSSDNGHTEIYLDTFENIGKTDMGPDRKSFKVFHNGSWVKGKKIRLPKSQIYKIITVNNKELFVSDNQLNPTSKGLISTKDLTTNDYLLFSNRGLNSYCERDLHLTYDEGFVIGLFLRAGSFGKEIQFKNGDFGVNEIYFSFNEGNYLAHKSKIDLVNKKLGGKRNSTCSKPQNNGYRIRISSKPLFDFIVL